jgi:hypothetical protein
MRFDPRESGGVIAGFLACSRDELPEPSATLAGCSSAAFARAIISRSVNGFSSVGFLNPKG